MKKQLIIYFIIGILQSFLWSSLYASPNSKDTISANHKYIEYPGRIDFSDILAPRFSFSGVSIRANFQGTSISVILEDEKGENYYNIVLDGEVIDVLHLQQGKVAYLLAENLDDTYHEIELFKRTELSFGKTSFFGFILDTEKSLVPISNSREKFIEYIGNSITCGYGNEGTNDDDFLASNENHYLTYAAITSRNFNARHMAVSRSGMGVYRNYNGPVEGNENCMANLYLNIFLYDSIPLYNFKTQPDLVCINLGTNDFSTTGGDSTLYVNHYLKLIQIIQSKYKKPDIVCLLGPMISGNTLPKVRSLLKIITEIANSKNRGRVSFFEMSTQTGDLGIGVHYHPTVAQHERNAQELSVYISKLKGWEIITKTKPDNFNK